MYRFSQKVVCDYVEPFENKSNKSNWFMIASISNLKSVLFNEDA